MCLPRKPEQKPRSDPGLLHTQFKTESVYFMSLIKMHNCLRPIHLLILSLAASSLVHIMVLYALGWFGTYDLTRPIMMPGAVMVDLAAIAETKPVPTAESEPPHDQHEEAAKPDETASTKTEHHASNAAENKRMPESAPPSPPEAATVQQSNTVDTAPITSEAPKKPRRDSTVEIAPPLRSAAEFLSAEQETLTYRITLLGFPVGSGTLEAKQENGEVKISLRVASNPATGSIYPVDDLIETRLYHGNYIITKIRQQEGSFKGNRGFTLFLREKSVFWIDLLKQTSTKEALPNSEVVDILSGLYYLRNRPLQTGKTETLHIFDSNIYTLVPVEVVRRETLSLPGFKSANTLLLHPLIKTEGIFKRAGDILIWVTDDENHVPVKVETSILLGKVTAELINSEVKRKGDEKKKQ